MKTISIPEDLHRELVNLKLLEGNKNAAELISKLVYEYKKRQFLESSRLFRARLDSKHLGLPGILKKSRKIREGISDEWF